MSTPLSSCCEIQDAYYRWKRCFILSFTTFWMERSMGCNLSVVLGGIYTISIFFIFKSSTNPLDFCAQKISKIHSDFWVLGTSPSFFLVLSMWGTRTRDVYSICVSVLAQWLGLWDMFQASGKSYSGWQAEVFPWYMTCGARKSPLNVPAKTMVTCLLSSRPIMGTRWVPSTSIVHELTGT